ncbi:hypothetical protein FI667_g1266, partial [Globisporangium splendens]
MQDKIHRRQEKENETGICYGIAYYFKKQKKNAQLRALIVFHTHVDITIFADDLAVDLSSRLAVVHRELRTVVALATRDGGAPRDVGAHAPVAHPRTLFVGALNSVAVATLEDLALDLVRRLLVAGWRRDPAGDLLALLLVLEETADQWDHGGGDRDPAHHESTSGFRVFLDLGGFSFGIGEAGGVSGRDDEQAEDDVLDHGSDGVEDLGSWVLLCAERGLVAVRSF